MSTTYIGDGLYAQVDVRMPGQLIVYASDGIHTSDIVYINSDNVASLISELLKHNIISDIEMRNLLDQHDKETPAW